MICYFIKNGAIVAAKEFPGLSAEEATERSRAIFEQRADAYDGFEVREGNWRICRMGRVSKKPKNRRR
jgi:hypothetical protein